MVAETGGNVPRNGGSPETGRGKERPTTESERDMVPPAPSFQTLSHERTHVCCSKPLDLWCIFIIILRNQYRKKKKINTK